MAGVKHPFPLAPSWHQSENFHTVPTIQAIRTVRTYRRCGGQCSCL